MFAGTIGLVNRSTVARDGGERLANYARVVALRFLASLRFRFTLGFS